MLSIEEAWNLPISAEMSSRQQQNSSQSTRNGSSQGFPKSYSGSTPQGPPPPYPSPGGGVGIANKRFKTEPDQKPAPQQAYNLTTQQLQLLNHLQQNVNTLTPAQQNLLQQLQHQYRLMQQNQQLRNNQRPALNTPVTRSAPTPPSYNNNTSFGQNGSPHNTAKSYSPTISDKLVQPNPIVGPRDFISSSGQPAPDLDENLEEDLKDLLSQKDLATTLAENLLKHFGSDDIDVKEETDSTNASGK